jgi:hypothetical protein
MAGDVTDDDVCGRCFSVDTAAGPGPRCGQPRRRCNLCQPDNPCRRPPMDSDGRIKSRAPLWWVLASAEYLRGTTGGRARD